MDSQEDRILFFRQLGFHPYTEYGCIGSPATPFAENSSADIWFDGAVSDQPSQITRKLFPHQLKSLGDMERFERKELVDLSYAHPNPSRPYARYSQYGGHINIDLNRRSLKRMFGLQADPVGYGKTLSVVALIARDNMEWNMETPYILSRTVDSGMMSWTYQTTLKRVNTTIVLASLSCIDQWEKEFAHAPSIKVFVVKTKKKVDRCTEYLQSNNSSNCDVVLASPSMFKNLMQKNKNVAWKRFVFDEPANLKIPKMPTVVAGFTWFVCATPRSIIWNQGSNWIGELLKRCSTGLMLFTVRNPSKFVQQSFGMPETIYMEYECYQPLAMGLRRVVPREILDRIEAGDIRGAIEYMGGSSSSKDNLVEVIRKKKQRDRDYIVFHLNRAESASAKKHWGDRLAVIEEQITQLLATAEEDLNGSCPICLDDLCEPLMEPNCGKLFCGECLLRWLTAHHTCPNCRQQVNGRELVHVRGQPGSPQEETKEEPKPPTKIECMEKIFENRLAENKDSKFILASQYSGGFDRIMRCLDRMEISYREISGHASTRKKIISQFNEGKIQVIFLGNLDSTAGVNLQAATDIIMYNNMSPAQRTQVIGRGNRVGRFGSLRVHTLKTMV